MKSFTDVSQSKKLAEFLPIESADMGWYYSRSPQAARNQMWAGTKADNADIPCWSLAALLSVLPKSALFTPNPFDDGYCCKNLENDIEVHDSNPIDACYEMIIKLKENNLL